MLRINGAFSRPGSLPDTGYTALPAGPGATQRAKKCLSSANLGLASAWGWETLRYTYAWISLISPQRQLYLTISRSQKSSAVHSIDFWNNFRQSQTWFMMMHIIDHLRRYLGIQNKKLCSHYVDGVRRQAKGRGGEVTVHFTGEVISTSE